jgi:hypothetical protein
MPLKLLSPGGGSVLLQANTTSLDYTLTVPAVTANVVTDTANSVSQSMLASGVVGKGPIFFARQTVSQSISSAVNTKITFTTEEFDTDNCYNTSTSRFIPNVAGYYHIAAHVRFSNAGIAQYEIAIFKNGSTWAGNNINQQGTNDQGSVISSIVYCNGTTDYIEIWANINGSSTVTTVSDNINGGVGTTAIWFTGYLVRAA